LLCPEASAVLRVGRPPRRGEASQQAMPPRRTFPLRPHGMAGRSLLNPEPAAELRGVDDAGDAGPASHEQPRNLRVAPARLGRGDGEDGLLLLPPRRLQPPLAEERAAPQELVRQMILE